MPRAAREVMTIALCSAACSVSAFDYGVRADRFIQQQRVVDHFAVVNGTAFAPDRYRVLVPFALNPFISLASTVTDASDAFREVYDIYYWAALTGLLYVLTIYLRQSFSYEGALVGAFFVASVIPITLRQHFLQPWSLLEPSLLTLGLIAADRRCVWPILPLAVAASLNRETGVFVPVAFLCAAPREPRFWRAAATAIIASVAIIVALRLWLGEAPPFVPMQEVWANNLSREGLRAAVVNVALFMGGAGWLVAALGFRRARPFARRASIVLALYLPVVAIWGVWYEVRLLLPLYPLLVPFFLTAVREWSPVPRA